MYRLTNKITVGDLRFNFVNEVTVDSSWENLTDTATITIPKNVTVDKKPLVEGVNSIFKIGDKVTIELGYDNENDTVFTGYVSDVKTTVPLQLQCEDGMWLYKQVSYLKTFKQVTVKELVTYISSKLKEPVKVVYSFPQLQLGKFRISNATGAQVLEELRKTYGIQSFFREGVLYVGFAYTHTDKNYQKQIQLPFTPNIIEDNLLYKSADNIKVKVKATSFLTDNKRIEIEVGDGDGITVPVFYYHKSKDDLTKLATNLQQTYKVNRFEGSVTTFGKPYVRQGDTVVLADSKIPERNGTYLVKKVSRTFGMDGYRQEITIDRRIS